MTDSPNLNNDTELRILRARAEADIPDGRIIRSGDTVHVPKEWGARFEVANVPPHHTHYRICRDGEFTSSGPLDVPGEDPAIIRVWSHYTSTKLYSVVTYTGTGEPTEPSTETFVIRWVKDD